MDVFACHGLSGAWGCIAAGILSTYESGSNINGLFYGYGRTFGISLIATLACAAYSFVVTIILYFILSRLF